MFSLFRLEISITFCVRLYYFYFLFLMIWICLLLFNNKASGELERKTTMLNAVAGLQQMHVFKCTLCGIIWWPTAAKHQTTVIASVNAVHPA